MAYSYGYQDQVDPELLRRAQQGPGLMAQVDAGLKSLTANAAPRLNNQYGVGSLPAPAPTNRTEMERLWSGASAPPRGLPAPSSDNLYPVTFGNYGTATAPVGTPSALTSGLPSPNDYARPGMYPGPAQGNPLAFLDGLLSSPNTTPPSGNAYTPQQMASSVPPDRLPGMQAASQRYGLSQQGYDPVGQGTDFMRRTSGGTTTYQQPGVTGQAEFQGLPGQGASVFGIDNTQDGRISKPSGALGYTGTPETAGMSQQEATAYNVANLNRQTEALRSLNEVRGVYGQPGLASSGGDNRAFGDLVSIGKAGGGVGDDVMARDRFMRQFDTSTKSGRQGLLQAQGLFDQQAQQQAGLTGTRLPAPPSGDPYKLAQLGLDQRKLGLDQLKFGLDQQQQQFNQGQTAAINQSLINQRAADGLPKPPTQSQVLGNIANDYYMTLQASRDPRLSEQERAGAATRLSMLHDAWNSLGGQQPRQDDFDQMNELVRKATNGMR